MKYFGTDGIRGIPNEKLTVELVIRLGKALRKLGNKEVCIATDTRISKDMLAYGVATGAMAVGLKVSYLGVLPTPGLIYYSLKHQMTGIMITASHNPYYDNGIKVFDKGFKLHDEIEAILEQAIDDFIEKPFEIGSIGYLDGMPEYLDFLKQNVVSSNLKICIDCANGATYQTAPQIFSSITSQLVVIGNQPNGYNINLDCGSTHLEQLKKAVVDNHCDIGFAFDGDGDRVLCVNHKGETIDGDKIIYILARYLALKGKLNQNKVVLSMMSNLGLISDLHQRGIEVVSTNVGDKYVVQALMNNHLSVGGENSGHIIMPDVYHTGDGVLIACYLIKILTEMNITIDDWLWDIKMYADCLMNVRVQDRTKIMDNDDLKKRVEEMKSELKQDCKIIVRASGTEELIRITVMAQDEEKVHQYADELKKMVEEINE